MDELKGKEGGICKRSFCSRPAMWFNHGAGGWYCPTCRLDIQFDQVNKRDWEANFQPDCGHPMFETRQMIDARKSTTRSAG